MWPRLSVPRLPLPCRCLLALSAFLYPSGTLSTPFHTTTNFFVDSNRRSCALYNSRRQRAEHVLTIATAVQPVETAVALRLARAGMRSSSPALMHAEERLFLRHVVKEGVARGVACAAGGAVASYAILKVVLTVIPLVPSARLTRLAMGVVSVGAAVADLATVPDLATIELLLMSDSELGGRARASIERYDPQLLLLQTLDRHMSHMDRAPACATVAVTEFELQHNAPHELLDCEQEHFL